MIAAGLALAVVSSLAVNGGYALQHAAACSLPALTLRQPLRSLVSLARNRRWFTGFAAGVAGWVLYVAALRVAPLSLVQAASAGGVGVLAVGGGRLRAHERLGVGAALAGLVLLAVSLDQRAAPGHASVTGVALWLAGSAVAAAAAIRVLGGGAGLGTAAGVLYAAGDVATKLAVEGGSMLAFAAAVLAAHGLAFVCLQLAFQRGRRLGTAGSAVLWTNALPIAAGTLVFGEALPPAWRGLARVTAFALVVLAAAALSGEREAKEARPSPA